MAQDNEQPDPSLVRPPEDPEEQPSTTGVVADDDEAEIVEESN